MIDIYRQAGSSSSSQSVAQRFDRQRLREQRRRLTIALPEDADRSALSNRHALGITDLLLAETGEIEAQDGVEMEQGAFRSRLLSSCRSGRVNVWDLNLRTRRRKSNEARTKRPTWESFSENGSEDHFHSETDSDHAKEGVRAQDHLYTLDASLHYERPTPRYINGRLLHDDWINAISYLPRKKAVVTVSNDRYVKIWKKPTETAQDSVFSLGQHEDYVRCLAHGDKTDWVASGGADRDIRLWDTGEGRQEPVTKIRKDGMKSSTFSLSTDESGSLIAHGSPSAVVQLYDPRTASLVASLPGHTGNLKSLIVSSDGRYLLSGSADTTIKLWSLTAQRCIETFSFHSHSIWRLHSSDPSLSIFYAGDAAGYVTKTDVSHSYEKTPRQSGECVVLCKEVTGTTALTAADDTYIWTGTVSGDIRAWKDTLKKEDRNLSGSIAMKTGRAESRSRSVSDSSTRVGSPMDRSVMPPMLGFADHEDDESSAAMTINGLPLQSLIDIEDDDDSVSLYNAFPPLSGATTYHENGSSSPTQKSTELSSRMGLTKSNASQSTQSFEHPSTDRSQIRPPNAMTLTATPLHTESEYLIPHRPALIRCKLLTDRRRVVTLDTEGFFALWNVLLLSKICQWTNAEARSDQFDRTRAHGVLAAQSRTEVHTQTPVQTSYSFHNDDDFFDRVVCELDDREPVVDWCTVDVLLGRLNVRLDETAFLAEMYPEKAQPSASSNTGKPTESIRIAGWLLRSLFDPWIRAQLTAFAAAKEESLSLTESQSKNALGQDAEVHDSTRALGRSSDSIDDSRTSEFRSEIRPASQTGDAQQAVNQNKNGSEKSSKLSSLKRFGHMLGSREKKTSPKAGQGTKMTVAKVGAEIETSTSEKSKVQEQTEWMSYKTELFDKPSIGYLDNHNPPRLALPDRVAIAVEEKQGHAWSGKYGLIMTNHLSASLDKSLEQMPEWLSIYLFQARVPSTSTNGVSPLRQPGRVSFRCYTEDPSVLPPLKLDPKVQSLDGKANAYSFYAHVKVSRVVDHIAERLGCISGIPLESFRIDVETLRNKQKRLSSLEASGQAQVAIAETSVDHTGIPASSWLELLCGSEVVDLSWSALKVQRYMAKNASPIHFTYRIRPGTRLLNDFSQQI